MAKQNNKAEEPSTKTLLVQAAEGKGYFLTRQGVYVSSRPYVVQNNPQLQMASARGSLEILGETKMSDEEFNEAFIKDPSEAIEKAVGKSKDADPKALSKAQKRAEEAASKKARDEEAEKARIEAEEKIRIEEEKAHAARVAKEAK